MDEAKNDLTQFPPEVKIAVEGLIHLGELSEDFSFAGHTFTLRTLRAGEEIAAAQAVQTYRETLKEPDAWMAAQVGLALVEIDGQSDFCPQAGPDLAQFAKARFNYITTNWYWPTIQYLFRCYSTLLEKQLDAIQVMQDLSPRSQPISSLSADSFSEQDTLNAEMLAEIQGIPS